MEKKRNHLISRAETISGRKDDKVRVTSFSVKPVHPEPGEPVTIRMSIKNVSGMLLKSIPWQIIKDKSMKTFLLGKKPFLKNELKRLQSNT